MKSFEAKKVDLDLELTTLDGEVVKLSPKVPISTTEALRIMDAWSRKEKESEEGINKVLLIGKELEIVYEKKANWWADNFDIGTLSEVLVFVAEAIGGVRKKEASSN